MRENILIHFNDESETLHSLRSELHRLLRGDTVEDLQSVSPRLSQYSTFSHLLEERIKRVAEISLKSEILYEPESIRREHCVLCTPGIEELLT